MMQPCVVYVPFFVPVYHLPHLKPQQKTKQENKAEENYKEYERTPNSEKMKFRHDYVMTMEPDLKAKQVKKAMRENFAFKSNDELSLFCLAYHHCHQGIYTRTGRDRPNKERK